eukprot:6438715-Pyramimonas_sp.AAC.1
MRNRAGARPPPDRRSLAGRGHARGDAAAGVACVGRSPAAGHQLGPVLGRPIGGVLLGAAAADHDCSAMGPLPSVLE